MSDDLISRKAFILVESENCIRYGSIHRQRRLDPVH